MVTTESTLLNPDAVRGLMARRTLGRAELCRRAGISPSYLSRILNARVKVRSLPIIESLARVLEVEPGTLMTEPGATAVRIAAPPHLWSAPFLNLGNGGEDRNGSRFAVAGADQSFTGNDALAALRSGDAELALAFQTPVAIAADARVVALGSICTGNDYVRLLIHRRSPLLRPFERFAANRAAAAALRPPDLQRESGGGAEWQRRPTACFHAETIAGDYVQHLENRLPELEQVRPLEPDPARPWLDAEGRPFHLIVTWEPIAAAIVASSDGEIVDVFDALDGELPTAWLPRLAEYQMLISRDSRLRKEELRRLIRDVHDAVRQVNHLISKSRIVLQHQPVIDRLIASLSFETTAQARSTLRQLLTRRLGRMRFQARIRPEIVTTGLL